MTCTRMWEVRAIDEGRLGGADVAAFDRHVRVCASCRAGLAASQELRELARELKPAVPSELDLRRLRGRILKDAMTASRVSWPRMALGAVSVAAAVALIVGLAGRVRGPSADAFAATVAAVPGAAWTQARDGGLERVVLVDGDLTFRVRKQGAAERFLVVLPDGEIEVRGTTFEVGVHAGRTARVHVDEGVVMVRVHGESVLTAGQSWVAPPEDVPPARSVDRVPAPSSVAPVAESPQAPVVSLSAKAPASRSPAAKGLAGHAGSVAPTGATDTELFDYERAVGAYRLGKFEQAADLLHSFAVAHPSSSFLDDASFLEASSLASAGHVDAAGVQAARHRARFPGSFHGKDAAILVARARRDQGDCQGARAAVSEWLRGGQPDPAVDTALGPCALP